MIYLQRENAYLNYYSHKKLLKSQFNVIQFSLTKFNGGQIFVY